MIKARGAVSRARRATGGRYNERVADVGVPLDWDQAQAIEETPDDLRDNARAMQEIASDLSGLAASIGQDRRCPECDERIPGDKSAASTLRQLAARLQSLASAQESRADQVDQAADRIGESGATLWFGEHR
jgi:hypothetical protein